MGRPGSGALPPPTARPLGGLPGTTTHSLWARGRAGVWTCHQPDSARSCELALPAVGAARGCPGGAPPAWVWGVRGRALFHPRLPALWAGCRAHYPLAVGAGGCVRGNPSPTPQRALLRAGFARCGGGTGAPGGGRLLPACGASGVGCSPCPDCPPSGRAAGPHYPLAVGAGGSGCGDPSPTAQRALLRAVGAARGRPGGGASCRRVGRPGSGALPAPTARPLGGLPGPTTHWLWVRGVPGVGTHHQPHSARSCVLWGRHEGARGGRLLPGCGASGVGRSPGPDCPPSGRAAGAHYPLAVGAGGCGRGDPSPTQQRALLCAGFARCGGGTRAHGGGASCLGVGRPGWGALPTPTTRPFGRVAGARFPLALGAVCRRRSPAVFGTLSRAAVRRVLCALPGFAAPGGRYGLAPVLVPWLLPAACVSGGPRGPALVRRSSSLPVALCAVVGFPVAVVPSPTPGAVAPGFTAWLRGERGGWPRTGLMVPAAGPCRGKGAGRALRRTRSGPRDGVVPGGSLRLRSWAVCAAGVWRVWTRLLTRPVSRTVRLATGELGWCTGAVSCGHRHRPFRVGGRHRRVPRV